jgi:ketosteroid isomerase-like protein
MTRRALSVAVLALSLAVPAVAQQKDPSGDHGASGQQDARQQIEAFLARHFEAVNRGDAPSVAADYVPNGIAITPAWGIVIGPAAIEQHLRADFAARPGAKETITVDQVQAIGNDAAFAVGPFTLTMANNQLRGSFAFVLEREAATWKVRLASFSRLVTPAGGVGSTTPPAPGTSAPAATGTTTK